MMPQLITAMNLDYWTEHFRRNQDDRPEPDWNAPVTLRGPALAKLVKSLQQFQLGDGGGPAYLIAWNHKKLLASDAGLKSLVDLWFAEEREHSRLLGGALRRFFAPEIREHWSFSLFCGVRKLMGSHVYYKMLRKHIDDAAVRGLCALIIRDEAGHIAFHRARLTAENRRFGKGWELMFRLRGLAAGTVLWVNHRGALRAAGATDGEFYRGIWHGMDGFIRGLRGDLERARVGASMKPCAQMVAECA
jgi:hypothetical protein